MQRLINAKLLVIGRLLKHQRRGRESKRTPYFVFVIILFAISLTASLLIFTKDNNEAQAADETCYWVGANSNWNEAANWSNASGGAGSTCAVAGGVPDSGTAVIFDAGDTTAATTEVNVDVDSLDIQSGYVSTFTVGANFSITTHVSAAGATSLTIGDVGTANVVNFNANNVGTSLTIAGDVVMDTAGTVSMGPGTWTVSGSFNNADVTTFNRNTSTLVMKGGTFGSPKELVSHYNRPLNNITIDTGAFITEPTAATSVEIRGLFLVSGTYTISSGEETYSAFSPADTKITSTGAITGAGTYRFETQSKLTQKDNGGVIDVTNLYISRDHSALYPILPTTFESANVFIDDKNVAIDYIWIPSATLTVPYTFNGNVTFTGNTAAAGTYTIKNDTNNPNFVFKGNVTIDNGTSTLTWTKGTGTITAGGTAAQSLNFLGKTVEDLNITNTGGTVSLLTSAVTTDSLTVASNATFDLAGNNMLYSAAANTTNNGTIVLVGNETLTNVNHLGITAGTVRYKGAAAGPYTIKDFGATDYFNLTINATAPADVFRTTAAQTLTLAGTLTLTAGTFDNATNDRPITIAGDVTMDNGTTSMGDNTWTVSGNFDNKDVSTAFNRDLSILVMDGATKTLTSAAANDLNDLTISGTISIPALSDRVDVMGACFITAGDTITIDNGETLYLDGSNADLTNNVGSTITGNGTLTIANDASISQQSGTLDVDYLSIQDNHAAANYIAIGTYSSANVTVSNTAAAANQVVFANGNVTFEGDVVFDNTNAGGTYTVLDSTFNPTFTFEGDVTVQQTAGTITWTKGTGLVIAGGAAAQSLDFFDETIEDLYIPNTGGIVSLSNNGVTTDALSVDPGASFDLASQPFGFTVASSPTNNGTIYMRGDEVLTNVNDLDTTAGTVVIDGAIAYVSLPNYSYYDLVFTGTGSWLLTNPLSVANDLTVVTGTINAGAATTIGGDCIVANGTFNSGASAVNVTDTLAVVGGSFTAPTTTLNVTGGLYILGGAFNSTSGTINLTGIFGQGGGTFNSTSGTINFANIFSISGGTFNSTSGTLNLGGLYMQAGGTFNGSSGTTNMSSDLVLADGVFNAGGGTIYLAGNFNHLGGTFTADTGTINFGGTNQLITGDTTFYNLIKSTATANTLLLEAGKTQTVTGTLTLNGASGQLLSLRSTADGSQWNLHLTGTPRVSYVDVKDSNLTGNSIEPSDSVNSGNNSSLWIWPSPTPTPDYTNGTTTATEEGYYAYNKVKGTIETGKEETSEEAVGQITDKEKETKHGLAWYWWLLIIVSATTIVIVVWRVVAGNRKTSTRHEK